MRIDHELFEEVWEGSKEGWENFKSDARYLPGYNEEFLRDAFMAGVVTAVVVMGNMACDEMEEEIRKRS